MSPVVSTRAGASANAYGWTKLALGGGYWALKTTLADVRYQNIANDSSQNLYVKYDDNPGAANTFAATVAKVDYSGTVEFTKKFTPSSSAFNSYVGGLGVLSTGNIAFTTYTNSPGNTRQYIFLISSAGAQVAQKEFGLTNPSNVGRGIAISENGSQMLGASTDISALGPMATTLDTSGNIGTFYGSNYATQVGQWDIANSGAQVYSNGGQGYLSSPGSKVWSIDSGDLTFGGYFNSSNELFGFGVTTTAFTSAGAGKLSLVNGTSTTWARGVTVAAGGTFKDTVFAGTFMYSVYAPYVGGYHRILIVKRNQSDGLIVWQREFNVSGLGINSLNTPYQNTNCIVVDPTDSFMWIQFVESAFNGIGYIFKLPTDGSKTGSYNVGGTTINYSASTYTDAARTVSRTTNGSTFASYSGTQANTALTFANGSALSTSKTTIN